MSNSQESFFNDNLHIGTIDFLELQSGIRSKTIPIIQSPPFGPNSKILGFKRTVSGGVVGTPFLAGIDIGASPTFTQTATIKSTSATDTSFYILYYINSIPQDNVKSALNLI
jgi:hypothetical protein